MRVLHVTESRGWSGGTVQLWNLCLGLVKRGHAVGIFCPPDGELARHAAEAAVPRVTCPLREDYDVTAARRLADFVREFRPDIVHAHHPRAHAIALLASFFGPIPRLIVSRRVSFRLKKWNPFSQWKYRSGRIHGYVAVADDIRRVLVAGGVAPEKVSVIYSGVDVEKFAPRPPDTALAATLGLPPGVPVIGNVTHYSWWKGQAYFLEAAQKVLATGARAHFLLVGKDTDGPDAQERVSNLGIGPHVTLAGFRTDMPAVLSLLSASVVSSLSGEGFSGVLRESMCMNVPVIATRVGGNGELTTPGETGLLVPPADGAALAAAMTQVLTDPTGSQRMAAAARANVVAHFSLDAMVNKTIQHYQGLLG